MPQTSSLDGMLPGVYRELCGIAHRQLRTASASLSTSELVHEAYLKLAKETGGPWRDRGHFFAVASLAMRHILVDRARARVALKRDGTRHRVSFDEEAIAVDDQADLLLEIDRALTALEAVDERLARVVEWRFFGGMAETEIAASLGVTVRTVERDWAKARMLLRRLLGC